MLKLSISSILSIYASYLIYRQLYCHLSYSACP
jgi:hypothetical protein